MDNEIKSVCPLCGSNEYIDPGLDEDVKDAFLESILGGVPFCRTYDELGGKISVTVVALDDSSNKQRAEFFLKLYEVSDKYPDFKAYIPLIEASLDIDGQVTGLTITKGDSDPKHLDRTPNSGLVEALHLDWSSIDSSRCDDFVNTLLDTFSNNLFGTWKIPQVILRGAVGKHNTLLGKLLKACLDENFIKGTGR